MSELKAHNINDLSLHDIINCDFYIKSEADKVIAEKDTEIAELKAENAQLMKEMKFMHSNCKWHAGDGCDRLLGEKLAIIDDNVKLKQKLEDAKATHYAEMVDAGMRERRLKRALWLERAKRAKEKQQLFHFSLGYEKLCIDGFYDPYSGRRELSPKQWIKAFNKVEVKLLKKAEEYK